MATMTFLAWKRSKLLAEAQRDGGRLKGAIPLKLEDKTTGQQISDAVPVLFTSANEVAGLKPGAIRHLAPKPSTPDAETTKLVHVDFSEPDLPWRYTPRAAAAGAEKLEPWIVLLVGTTKEMQTAGGLVTRIEPAVLTDHDLKKSHLWAHVHVEGTVSFSRLLSPRQLLPQREYVAAIVPAFDAAGEPRWSGAVLNGVLPAFFSWNFWTAEEGDFETLATALKLRKAGDLGKAKLQYRRPVANVDVPLEARGAITSLQPPEDQVPDEEAALAARERVAKARADLDILNNSVLDEEPPGIIPPPPLRKIIQLPSYGGLWLENTDESLWTKSLNDDPRHRGIAGLGLWMGIVEQESLMDAAVQQAGALQDAGQRIAHLAFGLDAAGRLWKRRLPETAPLRLRVFGPAMGRMLADGGGTVLSRVTSTTRALDAAIFSSAGQRLLRNGTGRARFTATGLVNRAEVLNNANEPPPPVDKTSAGLPHVDVVASRMNQRSLEEALRLPAPHPRLERLLSEFEGRPNNPQTASDFARLVNEVLGLQCQGSIEQFLTNTTQPTPIFLERELLLAAIDECLGVRVDERAREAGLHAALPHPQTPDERLSIDLEALASAVALAIDPTQAMPPARERVGSTIKGLDLTSLAPPEAPIGLDYPTWTLLNKHSREWLLPGSGSIPRDSIVALRTNPTFIDAFMVGINTQFTGEMRWRLLPAPRVSTPLRMFWGYVNYELGKREPDIRPIADWPSQPVATPGADDVGALSHQAIKPGDTTGKEDLVIAFHTSLFRRYPSTLVYLVRPGDDSLDDLLKSPPDFNEFPNEREKRRYFGPIFFGQMEPDLVFFAFDVPPKTLDEFWLVLDEPPAELRFKFKPELAQPPSSAEFAVKTIDRPTRVAISGAELEQQGLNG